MRRKWIAGLLSAAMVLSLAMPAAAEALPDASPETAVQEQAEPAVQEEEAELYATTAGNYGDLRYTVNSDGATCTITGCNTSASGALVIPETIDGYRVTSIGDRAFYYCSSLTSITIPDGVTSIGDHAFYYCSNLTSVTIPDGVTSIGDHAFEHCSSLTSVTIPNSVMSIGNYAFYHCSNLTSITIPDSVTSIGGSTFFGCSSLTSVTICDGVTSIGWGAFEYCSSLTSVTIPDSVTSIGNHAFEYCSSLTSVTIPDSVTSIGGDAFYRCSSLTDVYYSGSESDRSKISIGSFNNLLTSATWHYNCTGPGQEKGSSGLEGAVTWDPSTWEPYEKEKNAVGIIVYSSAGGAIEGASVTANGTAIGQTDQDGLVYTPYPDDGRLGLVVEADGYFVCKTSRMVRESGCTIVTLVPTEGRDYVCNGVLLNNSKDVTSEEAVYFSDKGSNKTVTLTPYFAKSANAEPIARIALIQDGTELRDCDPEGWMEINLQKECKVGKELFVVAYDSNGTVLLKVPLKISIQNDPGSDALKIGTKLGFTVSDDVPILGGNSMNIDFGIKAPVRAELDDNGNTIKVYIGDAYEVLKGSDTMLDDTQLSEGEKLEDLLYKRYDSMKGYGGGTSTEILNTSAKIKVYGYGEAAYQPDSTSMKLDAKIYLVVTMDTGATYYFPVTVPIYVDVKFAVNGTATGEASIYIKDAGFQDGCVKLSLSITPSVTLGAGVGFNGVVDAHVEGNGKVALKSEFPEGKYNVDLTLSASIGANVLCFSYSNTIAEKTWKLYPFETSAKSVNAALYNASAYTLTPRSYGLDKSAQAGIVGQVQAGVYPYAAPQLAELQGTQYLFYLDDASERGDADRTVLCYRKATASGWSDPVRVQDDGTGDYSFALLEAPDGLYVLWQNTTTSFGNACDSLQTMQKAIGLTAAKITASGVQKTWTLNTTRNRMPVLPALALNEGGVTAVWAENTTNALDGSGTNTIYAQTLDGKRSVYATLDCPILTLQAGTFDGNFTVAWTQDMDGDMSTTADREICICCGGQTTRLTDNDVLDSNPQFVPADESGALIWYCGNNFLYLTDPAGTPASVLENPSGSISDNYQICASDGRAVLIFRNSYTVGDVCSETLYGTTFDGASWTDPAAYVMSNEKIGSMDVLCSTGGATSLAYTLTSGEKTSLYAGTLRCPGVAQITEMDFSENDYIPGEPMPMTLTVSNTGNGTGTVTARFSGKDGTIPWTRELGTLAAGESGTFALENVVLDAGEYTLEILTDDILTDQYPFTLGNTDLSVVSNTYYSNGERLADIVVRNLSHIPTGATLKLTPTDDPDNVLYTDTVENIAGNEAKAYVLNLDAMFGKADVESLTLAVTASEQETHLGTNSVIFYNEKRLDEMTLVSLNKEELTLKVGEASQLIATTEGSGSGPEWSCNNEDSVTVDENGLVTAVSAGTGQIVCKFGKSYAYCTVTVIPADPEPPVQPTPTATPTAVPTVTPTAKPTATPTAKPTATPTPAPTATPTARPTATPIVAPTATPTATPTAKPTTKPTVKTTPMYRLYNPNSGEHFYTGSIKERDNLSGLGWNYEGVAWNAPTNTGTPVYRMFNPNSGDHHYTMSQQEVEDLKAIGWRYEGVCWNSGGNVPQFRLYNPNADCGSHHYTSSEDERDKLVALGWNWEGIGWFGSEQ